MVFPDPNFLFFFLPALLGVYYIVPRSTRNSVLLLSSLAFYAFGGGILVVLLLISILVDYSAGRIVSSGLDANQPHRVRRGIALSVLVNLGLLGYFKYSNWLVDQINTVAASVDLPAIAWTSVALPIGISFYTFQSMSYTIDIARDRAEPQRRMRDFALYVALFPQLIAGPIVRFHEIATELTNREHTVDDFATGVVRFAHGLVKKVVVADAAAVAVEAVFTTPTDELTTAAAWLGVLAYTIQIYFDFSGYSDMAIGLGQMFGFHFPENFRRPYSSVSITDFWRRWHITLSNWFRDYLYIPLGGSRDRRRTTYRNLTIVFLLTGLWHGANWTFVIWGIYHGVLLVVERITGQRALEERPGYEAIRRSVTLLAVMIGWVFFRSESLAYALGMLDVMFSASGAGIPAGIAVVMTDRIQLTLLLSSLVFVLPRSFVGGIVIPQSATRWAAAGRAGVMLLGLPYALALLLSGSFTPFLYYQF